LKYWLTREADLRKKLYARKMTGIAAVLSDDSEALLRIENIGPRKNLTPWLRRRDSVPVHVPGRLKGLGPKGLSQADMRKFTVAARRGPEGECVEVRIHAMDDRFVVHAELGGSLASRVVPAAGGELRVLLTRLSLKYGKIHLTLIGSSLERLAQIAEYGINAGLSFEYERMRDLRQGRDRSIREVLVLTNIYGERLPELDHNLPFWSRGVVGYRFRHIYGNLTRKRAEAAVALKKWDCLIYRGHGRAEQGSIAWNLADGVWNVPPLTGGAYLHLSCLGNIGALKIDRLPAGYILTPLRRVEDFDDAAMVRLFLEKYRTTGSLASTVRTVQGLNPEFACISCMF